MNLLQLREKEIFETLKKIKKSKFVIIGGYAVNCYTLPRFSVDCDIVVENKKEATRISEELENFGYVKINADNINSPYHGEFVRYVKDIQGDFKTSIDMFIKEILDRQTNVTFSVKWVFENSDLTLLKGKTITDQLKVKVINSDALIVMKFITCRATDIMDVFMLIEKTKNINWIKQEISKRHNFKERFNRIKNKITSEKFKDNLQGVYGYIDLRLFEKHKKTLLEIEL